MAHLVVGGQYIVNPNPNYTFDPAAHVIHVGNGNGEVECGLPEPGDEPFVHERGRRLYAEARETLESIRHNCESGCAFSRCCRPHCFG